MWIIWDDYTNELWAAFENRPEAETYFEFQLEEEGQQKSHFSLFFKPA